ncbi:hypothetical protein [Lactiplantibacillus paraplantarum]|uniref:Uncharacterized protein n=1 Tax=Lactiplantibacillus paraplantarum TaxID=60520 RepID=A0AAD0TP65_9LACO|nr:hypothetical protein [Lactiplantibacillus paraplantarum]AYJ38892.1 hypothetical protein LP667_08705 [Lactiplantibacillus paraplantarum]AYJ38946.1 hypothetical protein LP667_09000 [Lactiplantibacillus paraplantarum]KRL51340.1 hypothetical protein FD48_GL000020 [Lactiplantibacillus paraplantarum DSM 10667]MCU4683984.1 hypothetical protein [Lactiplantibacillus paraplantarum]MDL2061080.1 hypothetical protein [Lactiplantibacillus paraplantarum]
MDQKSIQQITKLVTELVRNERKRQFANEQTWRVKNTKLLLKNYDILTEHSKDIDTDIDQYLKDVFSQDDLKIRSIVGYKARTKKMMEYTDLMLQAYHSYASKRDMAVKRRYFVIQNMYINPQKWTFMKIADYFNVSEKTIKRDQKEAIQEFSIFLFGIVSLEEMVG